MNKDAEKRIAAKLAKTMAMLCVRNTHLEAIHAGKTPVSRTDDWSDVTMVDADGNSIPWTDVSHISDDAELSALADQAQNTPLQHFAKVGSYRPQIRLCRVIKGHRGRACRWPETTAQDRCASCRSLQPWRQDPSSSMLETGPPNAGRPRLLRRAS